MLSTIKKDYRHVYLGFSHRIRGEPQHKSLSVFSPCNRKPEETPLEYFTRSKLLNAYTLTLTRIGFWLNYEVLGCKTAGSLTTTTERTIVLAAVFLHMMAPHCKENIALSPGVYRCLWRCSRQPEPEKLSYSLHQLPSLLPLFLIFSLAVRHVSLPD